MENLEAIATLEILAKRYITLDNDERVAISKAIEALRMCENGCKVEIPDDLMKKLVRRGIEDAIRDFHEMGYTDEDIVLAIERLVENESLEI